MGRVDLALILLALAGCVGGRDSTVRVELQVVDERGEPIPAAFCHFALFDSIGGHRFTVELSPRLSQEVLLHPDDRPYRVEIACDGFEGRYDSGWLEVRKAARAGVLDLGRVVLRRELAPRIGDGDPAGLS
jgi:hypothetical protein